MSTKSRTMCEANGNRLKLTGGAFNKTTQQRRNIIKTHLEPERVKVAMANSRKPGFNDKFANRVH